MNNKTTATTTPFRLQRPTTALGLLGCIFLFCLVISGVLLPFIPKLISRPEAVIRISVVIQDLLVFIIPAFATALIVTKLPARLLAIDRRPDLATTLLSIIVLILSIPLMNMIIEWNKNWHLPESMAATEAFFRQLEDGAEATSRLLMSGASLPSLFVSVLIVGVLAGFSEELFFRGALQRILTQTRINKHTAIWTVAILFSLFHFQLFGLVPRILLGAFFGYLLVWTKSLWIPIILHTFNNSLVVILEYINAAPSDAASSNGIESIGTSLSSPVDIACFIASIIMTIIGIVYIRQRCIER